MNSGKIEGNTYMNENTEKCERDETLLYQMPESGTEGPLLWLYEYPDKSEFVLEFQGKQVKIPCDKGQDK